MAAKSAKSIELTILMPCLNEAETVGACIGKAQRFLSKTDISGEVLIADNGSTDGSREIAEKLGARVVPVAGRGYGAASGHHARLRATRGCMLGISDPQRLVLNCNLRLGNTCGRPPAF